MKGETKMARQNRADQIHRVCGLWMTKRPTQKMVTILIVDNPPLCDGQEPLDRLPFGQRMFLPK